jgi:hypothetical protein
MKEVKVWRKLRIRILKIWIMYFHLRPFYLLYSLISRAINTLSLQKNNANTNNPNLRQQFKKRN